MPITKLRKHIYKFFAAKSKRLYNNVVMKSVVSLFSVAAFKLWVSLVIFLERKSTTKLIIVTADVMTMPLECPLCSILSEHYTIQKRV